MMKKTVTIIAASLVLAACNATPNATEKAMTTQNMQNTAWDKQYGGADKSYDSRLLALREQIAPRFEVLTFKDPKTFPGQSTEEVKRREQNSYSCSCWS